MDRAKLLDTLALVSGGDLLITSMDFIQWGRDIEFGMRYTIPPFESIPKETHPFKLIFRDCRELKYKVYAHIAIHELGRISSVADVVDMSLGQGNHRRDAQILTNLFSTSIAYGNVQVARESRVYDL